MDKIRTRIADKVLEISTSDSGEIKIKLERINRFRDFIEACQVLIQKYPEIESEFLRMIEHNDFDARIAASRVDTIIRLSENTTPKGSSEKKENKVDNVISDKEEDISKLDEILECIPKQDLTTTSPVVKEEKEVAKNLLESEDQIKSNISLEEEYVDFEEISDDEDNLEENPIEPEVQTPTQADQLVEEGKLNIEPNSQKETIKKVLQVLGIVVVIVILIFVIKFIINNWQILLWILGGCIVAAGVVWLLIKKKK